MTTSSEQLSTTQGEGVFSAQIDTVLWTASILAYEYNPRENLRLTQSDCDVLMSAHLLHMFAAQQPSQTALSDSHLGKQNVAAAILVNLHVLCSARFIVAQIQSVQPCQCTQLLGHLCTHAARCDY